MDFAYRYPFSKKAKDIISEIRPQPDDPKYLRLAKARIEEALSKGRIAYQSIQYGQLDDIISYAYARILVSALPLYLIGKYVEAEALRSLSAMTTESDSNVAELSRELGVTFNHNGGRFFLDFAEFLKNSPESGEYSLTNQQLADGMIELTKQGAAGMLKPAISKQVGRGLPIPKKEIPKRTLEYAREIALPKEKLNSEGGKTTAWIEKLLQNPIPDVRQRVVGLILAPYLITVKGMDSESAYRQISVYIEKCKALDPNTKVTDAQIRYQCNYTKAKGMRPLSFAKARDLLSGVIDFDSN